MDLINLDDDPEAEVIRFFGPNGKLIERLMTPEAMIIEGAVEAVLKKKGSKKKRIVFLTRGKDNEYRRIDS